MNETELIDRIYRTIADPAGWSDVLVSAADYLQCTGGMLVHQPRSDAQGMAVLGRLSHELLDVYFKHYAWDVWSTAMKDKPVGYVHLLGSLVDNRALTRTAFYADVLAPQGIEDGIAVNQPALARAGGFGGFGFYLSAGAADDAEHNRKRLQRLAPHLSRALDATLQLGPLIDSSRQLARVLQLMPSAALLLDNRQRIVHANPAAEQLLRAADGLTSSSNGGLHLSAVLPAERLALSRSLAQALRVADGSGDLLGEPLRVTRLSGAGPLLVVPVPLPPPAFSLWELTDTARLLVLVIDPNGRSLTTATVLQAAFGLTPAEARVATLIGSGLSGPRAAQVLGVSPTTVKTHLARCFEKLGIRSQVELARMLSALPPDPANFDSMN
jgi:DNA-binding CsgD family transcriptional regulator/PAS domain-containing protein